MTQTTVVAAASAGSRVPRPPLEELAHIRGAMWTARAPVGFGHRPYQPSNCICIDYFECFPANERELILKAYARDRRYTHAPMGPMVDPGYHGELPSTDWRQNPEPYFAGAEQLERAGVHVIHFLRPDRDVAGLAWTVEDLDRELGPVFRSARAQALMQIVCLGWEPGPRYYYDNAWWVAMAQWQARTFPRALRLIHKVSDQDSPVGGDDDTRGLSNGQGWANVAPYLHGTLEQYGGYVDGQRVEEFIPNLREALADMTRRFATGGPDGTWPTSSAWGVGQPLKVYAGEYAAYRSYWDNAPELDSIRIGHAAIDVCAGYFDGGA